MNRTGLVLGALIGMVVLRGEPLVGLVIGAIIGSMIDASLRARGGGGGAGGLHDRAVSDLFFRTTFELMGRVAKSDGRVSAEEIAAARGLMSELGLTEADTALAIDCFRRGKDPAWNLEAAMQRLREACGARHDLLRAFVELQMRAALDGNGLSLPARTTLTRVAERLGMSGIEFAHMESQLRNRSRYRAGAGAGAGTSAGGSGGAGLADCYRELEVEAGASDQEVTRAYRRQMSRHHPDKLVANGLPESMAQVAKEKTQRIQEAYEAIRAARGIR